jgi:hypothetical protein
MAETMLICDHGPCRKAAKLYRLRDGEPGTWKLVAQWKTTAANVGMLHACSNEHAGQVDLRMKIGEPLKEDEKK